MKKILLALVLLLVSIQNSSAYYFATDSKAEVTQFDGIRIGLKVYELDNEEAEGNYPIGTTLTGEVMDHRDRKHFLRDEITKVKITQATLPNGVTETVNQDLVIRPRTFVNFRNAGNTAIITTGGVLGITLDFLTIGLPVVRGGRALWEAGFEIYDTPPSRSKVKAGLKGFIKGALFPLPELILKGDALPLVTGSHLTILDADTDESKFTAVLISRKNPI